MIDFRDKVSWTDWKRGDWVILNEAKRKDYTYHCLSMLWCLRPGVGEIRK